MIEQERPAQLIRNFTKGKPLFMEPPDEPNRTRLYCEESYKEKLKRYTSSDFGMAVGWMDRKVPLLRLPLEQVRAVLRSKLGWVRKIAVVLALIPAFVVRYLAGRV